MSIQMTHPQTLHPCIFIGYSSVVVFKLCLLWYSSNEDCNSISFGFSFHAHQSAIFEATFTLSPIIRRFSILLPYTTVAYQRSK